MDVDVRGRQAASSLRDQVEPALDVEAARAVVGRGTARRRARHRALVTLSAVLACVAVGAAFALAVPGGGPNHTLVDGMERSAADQAIVDGLPRTPIDGKDSWRLPVLAQPNTGLEDGDTITMYGRGFDADETLGVVICASEAETEGAGACELGDDSYEFAKVEYAYSDDAGTVVYRLRVRRYITTPATGPIDCASRAERCLVAFGAVSNYDRSGGSYIDFAGAPDFPEPSAAIAPEGPYVPGDQVIVTGTDLAPGRLYQVVQCVDDDTCATLARGHSTPEGAFTAGVIVNSVVYVGDEAVECAERCTLRITGVGVEGASRVPFPDPFPLAFAAGDPIPEDQLPPPTSGASSGSLPEVLPPDDEGTAEATTSTSATTEP